MSVEQSGDDPFETLTEIDNEPLPSPAASGSGGSEMAGWSLPRRELLLSLITGPPSTNESQFAIPPGVLDSAVDTFQVGFRNDNGEVDHDDPDDHDLGHGVLLGRNVSDLIMSGVILAIPSDEDLELMDEDPHPLSVDDATIVVEPPAGPSTETVSGADGEYLIDLAEDDTAYDVTVSRPHFDPVGIVVEVGQENIELDIALELGIRQKILEHTAGATGLAAGAGVKFG